jgi:hypothetical protein
MKLTKLSAFGFVLAFLIPTAVIARTFGEYGRTLGGVTQQGGISPGASGGLSQSGRRPTEGVGDISGRGVPSRSIVAAKQALLFPRQDDEAEKIISLAQGEVLVTLLQPTGGNDWYMVKTQKGLIGWVKSLDVREQSVKK